MYALKGSLVPALPNSIDPAAETLVAETPLSWANMGLHSYCDYDAVAVGVLRSLAIRSAYIYPAMAHHAQNQMR